MCVSHTSHTAYYSAEDWLIKDWLWSGEALLNQLQDKLLYTFWIPAVKHLNHPAINYHHWAICFLL